MSSHPYTPDWRNGLRSANAAPRCKARCRRSKRPCKGPAMRGKTVCRMHGGKGGAPRGNRNGSYRHGRHTIKAMEVRREARLAAGQIRELIKMLRGLE